MTENVHIIKIEIERIFKDFTGRIVFDMFQGEVGAIEKTEKKRFPLKKKEEK